MADLLKGLNDNAGALTAISTIVYAVITLAILFEARATRNLRREALMDTRLMAHQPAAGMLLELNMRNLGPAVARDVVIEYWFRDPSGALVGERRRQGEQSMGPGDRRRFLPMTEKGLDGLDALGEAKLTIHARWSWTDDRRGFRRRPTRHDRELNVSTEQLRSDFYGGWALIETDPDEDLHTIAEAVEKLDRNVKLIADRRADT